MISQMTGARAMFGESVAHTSFTWRMNSGTLLVIATIAKPAITPETAPMTIHRKALRALLRMCSCVFAGSVNIR